MRQWLVDPLCGTLNYPVGNMQVAVNVALRDGAAVVADPFSGEVFITGGIALYRAAGRLVTGIDGAPIGEGGRLFLRHHCGANDCTSAIPSRAEAGSGAPARSDPSTYGTPATGPDIQSSARTPAPILRRSVFAGGQ